MQADHLGVCTIVLNYQTWSFTQACVESLLTCRYPNHTILVIDNASPNDSVSELKAFLDKLGQFVESSAFGNAPTSRYVTPDKTEIIFIESPVNGGYAAGNNLGLQYGLAHGAADYFWILNNDTVVHADALRALLRYVTKPGHEQHGPVGSVLLEYDSANTVQAIGGRYVPWVGVAFPTGAGLTDLTQLSILSDRPNYVIGAACFLSRQFVQRVGFMAEDYFLYYEDTEWTFRGKQAGFRAGFCLDSFVYHREGGSTRRTGMRRLSPLVEYYFARNKIRFARQYVPAWLPFIVVSVLGVVLTRLLTGNGQAAWLISKVTLQELTGNAPAYQPA